VLAVGLELRRPGDTPGRPGLRWERRVAYRLVDGGRRVELMQPGEGWACGDGHGASWVPDGTGSPVEDLG
jgi:hypothetical protein